MHVSKWRRRYNIRQWRPQHLVQLEQTNHTRRPKGGKQNRMISDYGNSKEQYEEAELIEWLRIII